MVIKEEFENSSIEVLHRDKARIADMVDIKATPRIEKLRSMYLERRYSVSIDKMRIETRVMKGTEGEPMEVRRGKVFAAVVRELPISIFPKELIVGSHEVNPRIRFIDPEELEAMDAGVPVDQYSKYYNKSLTDEHWRVLREEIIPYWKGEGKWEKTRHGRNYKFIPPEIFNRMIVGSKKNAPKMSLIYTPWWGLTKGAHIGHNSIGYKKVLEKGFLGIKKDAEDRLARLDHGDPKELKQVPFLQGVIIAMEAAAEIGKRFAAKAGEMAEVEEDIERKNELLKIADVCDRVPANPARTFHEALQSVFFARMLVKWETFHCVSHSVGRIEQFLNNYYESDIKKGEITKEKTQELIDCFLIKLSHVGHGDHVGVGGVKSNGQDATNDLSYMILEGMAHIRLVEPFISVMVHSKTPDSLLIKACQLLSLGTGHPVFINNDVQVEQMLARAIPLEHARIVTQVGCYEPVIAGFDSGTLSCGFFNLASTMELVMSNGWNHYYQKKLGLETGDPRKFKSFEELKEAFRQQVAWLVKDIRVVENIVEQTLIELCPTLYESALIEDCIEKGMSREAGGARYNFAPMVTATGAVDAGNSLAAIKKLVFEEEKITMDQLCNALERNFEGYDELRRILVNEPKFGNDDDYVDEQVAWVSHVLAEEVKKIRNPRGGYGTIIGAPMQMYLYAGSATGALPSGRLAGEPLSDGWSPSAGTDLNGPTSVFKSHGKIDHVELLCGVTLNLRLDPVVFKGESGIKRCMDMIRTFVDQKIFQVQINVISSETLRAAQKEPHDYRDVIVKVAGYSDYFVTLPKELQDGIIARTEHKL
ncbi:MAG: glycyl radical protein [Promethearchaeota archaeon]|jgi:formate C-acetyltransferase